MGGYELNDPKSEGYHDRMADYYDMRDKTTLIAAAKGMGDLPVGGHDHGDDDREADRVRAAHHDDPTVTNEEYGQLVEDADRADQARDAEAEDAWRRESDDVARTIAFCNVRHHGTVGDVGVPPERTVCPGCGTTVHPTEKKVGGIAYFNCRRCDFSTWDWAEWLPKPATDEEIERSFDAYR